MSGERVYPCNLAVFIFYKFSNTGSKDFRANQSAETAHHVDGTGACEIMEAKLGEPAAAPDPVRFNRIHQCGNDAGVYTVGQELRTLCHSAGYDGRCGRTEYQVEYEIGIIKILICGKNIKAGLSDESYHILAEQQPESNQNKYNCTDTKVHQVFHQDITGVLGSGKPCLHHGKACLHPEYQCGSYQEPDGK